MENQTLEIKRARFLSKENTRVYQAFHDDLKKQVCNIGEQSENFKQRIDELEKTIIEYDVKQRALDEKEKLLERMEARRKPQFGNGEESDEDTDDLLNAVIANEREKNNELQEARKILIEVFDEVTTHTRIGTKKMGQIDCKPFHEAMKIKRQKDPMYASSKMCTLWDDYIRDPLWQPFKFVVVEGERVEVVDEADERLKELRKDMGEKVYKAVTTALAEMNEYNPSGRHAVSELWNFEEGRKATLKEGMSFLAEKWRPKKPRRSG